MSNNEQTPIKTYVESKKAEFTKILTGGKEGKVADVDSINKWYTDREVGIEEHDPRQETHRTYTEALVDSFRSDFYDTIDSEMNIALDELWDAVKGELSTPELLTDMKYPGEEPTHNISINGVDPEDIQTESSVDENGNQVVTLRITLR